jgi:hypothetical protein
MQEQGKKGASISGFDRKVSASGKREEKQILRLTTTKLKFAWGPVRSG